MSSYKLIVACMFGFFNCAMFATPPTQSNHQQIKTTRIDLTLVVNSRHNFCTGQVDLYIDNPLQLEELVLDTKAMAIALNEISSSTVADPDSFESTTSNYEEEEHPELGRAWKIKIKPDTKIVRLHFVSEDLPGIVWNDYDMYTAMARSTMPCADTDDQRVMFNAKVKLANHGQTEVTIPGLEGVTRGEWTYFSSLMPIVTSGIKVHVRFR